MDINTFYTELDQLFESNDMAKVEPFIKKVLDKAKESGDVNLKLAALNELVGYLRSISRYEESVCYGKEALSTLDGMGLGNSVHAATTMLNTATALRGLKHYAESIEMYNQALVIFNRELPSDDYRIAGLYNNMSILYENIKDFENSKKYALKAIDIIKQDKKNAAELATSYTNVAQVCFLQGEYAAGKSYMEMAKQVFLDNDLSKDSHYGALLATFGQCCYIAKEYDEALTYYEQAIATVDEQIGKNDYYYMLKENYEEVLSKKKESEDA